MSAKENWSMGRVVLARDRSEWRAECVRYSGE